MKVNLANKITISRILLIPVFVILFYSLPKSNPLPALVFILAASTDFLDGYIARSRNLVSTFGKFVDPLADKILTQTAFILLVESGNIKAWIVVVILSRELIITAFRTLAASKNVTIAASIWGKFKTVSQMLCLIYFLFKPFIQEYGVLENETIISSMLLYTALILTLISGIDYLLKNRNILDLNNI